MNAATITISPSIAADAYKGIDAMQSDAQNSGEASSFSSTLQRAIKGAVETGRHADVLSMNAIAGHGDLTEVITAVSKAELALQSVTAIRDRVVQAYQDVMRMTI